jgi:hypothetical protein
MLNNFKLIEDNILNFKSDDDFYFVQILKRRKDNPGMEVDMKVIKNYYIDNLDYYYKKQQEIIDTCNGHNARAYIRLNKRSYKKTALMSLKLIAEYIAGANYRACKSMFDSAAGQYHSDENKKWIIDLDGGDITPAFIMQIETYISQLQPQGPKLITIIPTKNGKHLIVEPFNLQLFKQDYGYIDVHKDNLSPLYIP